MYGSVIGDISGSIYEFEQTKKIKSIKTGIIIPDNGFYSDDTILTVAIKDAIDHDLDYGKNLREYIREYEDYRPDFEPYFKTSFSPNIIKWSKGNYIGNSHGNGALMRISPVGFMFDTEKDVLDNAREATIPSHNSFEAIYGAEVLSLVILYLRQGLSKEEAFKMLNLAPKYVPFKKFNTTVEETLYNCLYVFYISNSFEDAIKKTLLMGGDTDTNCAIVGALAEAYYGIPQVLIDKANSKIPDRFVKVLKKNK